MSDAARTAPCLWYKQDFKKAYNDRINVSFQHQFPGQIVVMATYFTNFGHQLYNKALNNIDPQSAAQVSEPAQRHRAQSVLSLPRPDHHAGTAVQPADGFARVAAGPLSAVFRARRVRPVLRGGAIQLPRIARPEDLQPRATTSWSPTCTSGRGAEIYFNDLDTFTSNLTWQASDQPHHRFTAASTYEMPVGRGRTYFSHDTQGGGLRPGRLETHRSGHGDKRRLSRVSAT